MTNSQPYRLIFFVKVIFRMMYLRTDSGGGLKNRPPRVTTRDWLYCPPARNSTVFCAVASALSTDSPFIEAWIAVAMASRAS